MSVPVSRKKINAEIMYELRRQGMTNKQIADTLGCHYTTVYDYIGKRSQAVANAEAQNKPPVVDPPKTAEICAIEDAAPKADKLPDPPKKKPFLTVLSAKYTMQGEMCQYIIDTAAGTVEMPESASMVSGTLDKSTISRFIDELIQVRDLITKEAS